jgi:hypothetical protein
MVGTLIPSHLIPFFLTFSNSQFFCIAEVLLLEQEVVVIKGSGDCKIVVSGGIDEVSALLFSL